MLTGPFAFSPFIAITLFGMPTGPFAFSTFIVRILFVMLPGPFVCYHLLPVSYL